MPLSIHTEKMDPALQDQYSHNLKCDCKKHKSDRPRRRRLVVAFDGTQKQFGDKSSHVVEFYSRIVKSGDQLSYYTSGIGTFIRPSSNTKHIQRLIKNKWVSAVGHNFTSNILAGYRFLSEKYESGDQIFLLGFSRGAYQARVLAAMITKVGLLRTGNNEQIPFAFSMYTDPKASKDKPIDSDPLPNGKKTTNTAKEFKKAFCYDVNIHFVGVWDTVSSIRPFLNKYYPGAELAENICFFRHALALDERRVKFIPEYIFAKKEFFSSGEFGPPRCKEVWFRGCHSDVGGGKDKNITSDNGAIPSRWMAYEAMLAGLEMTPFREIKVKDLRPKISKYSMARFYTVLEYVFIFIKWESHSKDRPPLLEGSRTSEKPRSEGDFSRTWHRKRPRQIYDYQKLHLSVCLHTDEDPFKNPSAHLPTSWSNDSDWTRIVKLLYEPEAGSSSDSRQPANRSVGIEWDILDCDAIPALIAGVLGGTNVNEFLDRLRALTYTEKGREEVREDSENIRQFSLMLLQLYTDERYSKHTELAIQVAYNVFWDSEVDLYDSDEKLWKAILSIVERWNESQTDSIASASLHRAGQLLHQTRTEKARVEVKHTLIRMFDQWQLSFTRYPMGYSPAPIQLRFLLRTAVEHDARDDILRLSVLSSPYFLDAEFKETLLERLVHTFDTTGGEKIKLAMLYFCVLCAFDERVILDRESFDRLKAKFVELETPTKEMWELVLRQPQISNSDGSVGFSGGRETMTELKNLLQDDRIKVTLREGDLSWARRALDIALNLQLPNLLELANFATAEGQEEQPSSRA